jgi:uncharacterized protein with ATP-grasp and redox domains
MKSDPECLICMMKQAFNTVRVITDDHAVQREVLNRVAEKISYTDLNNSPAEISQTVYEIVSRVTGIKDPYANLKRKTNSEALKLIPVLQHLLSKADDPLVTALHIAVAGNIVDIGIGHTFNIEKDVFTILSIPFTIDDTEKFKNEIIPGRSLLYLGDNSGEIVFDRLLVQMLKDRGLKVTFCVKSGAIINDALMEDARIAGLTDIVPVIETGSNDIGINLNHCSKRFRKTLEESDIILAKGHGNFETCNELPYNFYFLLKAKCRVVARALGITRNDIAFKKSDKT